MHNRDKLAHNNSHNRNNRNNSNESNNNSISITTTNINDNIHNQFILYVVWHHFAYA